MYKHYCKDSQCPGHTKNWERCCDMRAFNASSATTPKRKEKQPAKTRNDNWPQIIFA